MTRNAEVIKKVCIVGSGGVGKTSRIKRLILNIFDDKYLKTLGTKVSKKAITVEYPERDLNIDLTLLVWDIMGQETFRPLLQDSYFYGAGGCIAVCDSTRIITLENLNQWIDSLYKIAGKVPLIFLANKNDLKDTQQIDENMLQSFATKYNAPAYFTSARTGDNVEKAFIEIGKLVTVDFT
jgi:small GTP-binding protein